jgi:hypothetical protein
MRRNLPAVPFNEALHSTIDNPKIPCLHYPDMNEMKSEGVLPIIMRIANNTSSGDRNGKGNTEQPCK